MEHKTYTQQEIDSAINILKNEEQSLLDDRKVLNALIREKRKNIKYYEELDCSQYKEF
jgi:prefoldin subunit 5